MAFDPYRILGVDTGATLDEIRRAYRDLAREVHPDLNTSEEAEDLFKVLGLAYSILSNAEKRSIYDEYGEDAVRLQFDRGKLRRERRQPRDADGLASALGGARRTRPHGKVGGPGLDLVVPLRIDAVTASRGGTVRVAAPVGGGVLTVTIPPGTRSGSRIRLVGKGRVSPRGGRAGNLYLEVSVDGGG